MEVSQHGAFNTDNHQRILYLISMAQDTKYLLFSINYKIAFLWIFRVHRQGNPLLLTRFEIQIPPET